MLDHISIGVRDLARAKQFYDAALRPLGYTCLSEGTDALGYGRDKIALWIGKAASPVPAGLRSLRHTRALESLKPGTARCRCE